MAAASDKAAQANKQADEAKDRPAGQETIGQDPYPVDPTNELLDGDDTPTRKDLEETGVKVSDGGTALVHKDDPSGLEIPPPQSANLELRKRREKEDAARAESIGDVDDPDEAAQDEHYRALKAERERRAGDPEAVKQIDAQIKALHGDRAKADAAEARKAKAEESDDEQKARSAPPSGRSSRPQQKA